jgi:Leucine-rich repeat (LRR) protein
LIRSFVLDDRQRILKLPEIGCKMEWLRSIDLRHTAINELPSSIEYLIGLEDLNLEGCVNLMNLPSSIHLLQHLKNLILVDCQKLEEIPRLPPYIQEVNARGCISLERFSEVSKRFESNTYDLPGLVWVDLSRCHKLLENMKNDVEKFLSVKVCL